jgi:hypothetical protein
MKSMLRIMVQDIPSCGGGIVVIPPYRRCYPNTPVKMLTQRMRREEIEQARTWLFYKGDY